MVGYGGMLLEGLVALIALSTVMILAKGDPLTHASPDRVYAEGLSRFVQHFGIPRNFARSFALLAFTTFIYDTLDVATRLARYILQELTGWKNFGGRITATFLSLLIPFVCVNFKTVDAQGNLVSAWRIFWTIFGTSNQLLAALTLMTISIWLMNLKRSWWISGLPMLFMMVMTLWSLCLMIKPAFGKLFSQTPVFDPIGLVALLLFALSVLLILEAAKVMFGKKDKVQA